MSAKKVINLNEVSKPLCSVAGVVAPGAMCGHVIVGRKYCGAPPGDCEHQKAEHVTREGIEVKRNQVWRDLDKRMHNRHVRVVGVEDGKAEVQACEADGRGITYRTTKISVSRMHKGSVGWALVPDAK